MERKLLSNVDLVQRVYQQLSVSIPVAKSLLGRPLTLAEKILYGHMPSVHECVRGVSYVQFVPDRVAMQDATAQMALLQFMQSQQSQVALPSTVHCDHLILAQHGALRDVPHALEENKEVYDFLRSACAKYNIGFWKPGAGIIHQVVLENYAFPGGMMIGTDSHTPNAGGLGMIAIGAGGNDAAEVMAGLTFGLKMPTLIGVRLTGSLSGWASAKDIILKLAGMTTVKGGTGAIVEYFGSGTQTLSATGKATICNMGAEIGATTSLFPYDAKISDYLSATGRGDIASLANTMCEHLVADTEVYDNPEAYYDQVYEIDLSTLEPYVNGPFSPDLATPISELAETVEKNGWPDIVEVALIGSCTNSSYEDISRAASVARQVQTLHLSAKSELLITPGSTTVYQTVRADGLLTPLENMHGIVMANACGPCIGQWARHNDNDGRKNTIVTSFNRNFAKRNDGNGNTFAFVASPEIVIALALAGRLSFNPLVDTLTNTRGEQVLLEAPTGVELPEHGFSFDTSGYEAPAVNGEHVEIIINPESTRLQLLAPFLAWKETDFDNLRLLIKTKGQCTTDQISAAGKWLTYRGHLDKISNNLLIGATNAFNGQINCVRNVLATTYGAVPDIQRMYKAAHVGTIVVGDVNYGEGSSREHAAMEPRYLGVRAIVAKSFARIHETNLKKQGMLACVFANHADYDKICEDDVIRIIGLDTFSPEQSLTMLLQHSDGFTDSIVLLHTYNAQQIQWFRAGSAMNYMTSLQKVVSQ